MRFPLRCSRMILTVLVILLGLVACASATPLPTEVPSLPPPTMAEPTAIPTSAPTERPTAAPTATPVPPPTLAPQPYSVTDFGEGYGYQYALSWDGTLLAVGSADTIRVVDSITFEELWSRPVALPVQSVAFSPDGTYLAVGTGDVTTVGNSRTSGSGSGAVSVWDTTTGGQFWKFTAPEPFAVFKDLAFADSGAVLMSADLSTTIQLWDSSTGQPIQSYTYVGAGPGLSVAYSPITNQLAAGYDSDTTVIWNRQSGDQEQVLQANRGILGSVIRVAFSPDGTQLLSVANTDPVLVYDTESGEQLLSLEAPLPEGAEFNFVQTAAFSPDGSLIAVGMVDRVALFSSEGEYRGIFPAPGYFVAFSPDSLSLFVGGSDGALTVWPVPH